MPDKIEQQLGIDAGAAIQALDTLNTKFKEFGTIMGDVQSKFQSYTSSGKTVVDQMRSIASQATKTATALGKLSGVKVEAPQMPKGDVKTILGPSGEVLSQVMVDQTKQASQQIQAAVKPIGPAVKQTMDDGKKAAASFIVSWETMGRVVSTQFIVRAMSQIRDAFRESIDEAIKFERRVAEIQTIAGGVGFDQIADGVAKIATSFNIPLIEAASGAYQALSNQVGDMDDTMMFMAEAAKFAKATNSSLQDSVDLLSGAMKSYNMDVEDTAQISSVMFTAIDKGRITADELANSFGRIGPAAAQIGISMEEITAALAEISVKGSATSESITQLRGIITALTKPTETTIAAMEKLGFATVEEAVSSRGLVGVLQDLAANADKGAISFAKMFPNVRGLGGAISLTSDDLKGLISTLQQAQNVSRDFIDEKFGIVMATDAEQVTKAFNNIKVAITTGFGQTFLDVAGNIARFTGAVDKVPPSLKQLAAVMGDLIIAFGSATITVYGFSKAFGLLKFHPVIAGFAALTAAIVAFDNVIAYTQEKELQSRLKPVDEVVKAGAKKLEELKKANDEEVKALEQTLDERLKLVRAGVQKEGQLYFERLHAARNSEQAILDAAKNTLQQVIEARKAVVNELQKGIDEAANRIRQADFTISSLKQQRDELEFAQRTENLDPDTRASFQIQRGTQQAVKAAQDYVAAVRSGNQEAQRLAQSQFDVAANTLRAAEATAKQAGETGLVRHAQQAQLDLLKKRELAEEQVKQVISSRTSSLEKELEVQKKVPVELEKLAAIIEKNSKTFDEQGQPLSQDQLKRQQAVLEKAIPQFVAMAQQQLDTVRFKDLGLDNLVSDVQKKLAGAKLTAAITADQASIAEMRETIKGKLAGMEIEVRAKVAELVRGEGALPAGSPTEANQDIEGLKKLNIALETSKNKADEAGIAYQEAFRGFTAAVNNLPTSELDAIFERMQASARSDTLFGISDLSGIENIRSAIALLQQFIEKGDVSAEAIANFNAQITELNEAGGGKGFQVELGQINEAITRLNEAYNAKKKLDETQIDFGNIGGQEKLNEVEAQLQRLQNANVGRPMAELNSAAGSAISPTSTITTNAQATAAAYERAAQALSQMSTVSPPPVPAAFGRFVMPKYRAAGGPIGSDTIPAMLSPGEMVINARSARQFFSQLQAINAGRQPIYRENGGSVTNVGDINVTVQGGQYTDVSARKMARELQREMRRGSSRL